MKYPHFTGEIKVAKGAKLGPFLHCEFSQFFYKVLHPSWASAWPSIPEKSMLLMLVFLQMWLRCKSYFAVDQLQCTWEKPHFNVWGSFAIDIGWLLFWRSLDTKPHVLTYCVGVIKEIIRNWFAMRSFCWVQMNVFKILHLCPYLTHPAVHLCETTELMRCTSALLLLTVEQISPFCLTWVDMKFISSYIQEDLTSSQTCF